MHRIGDNSKINKETKYDVSFVVACYNPVLHKALFTLNSILKQTGIKFEIIIADDGSKNNCFVEFEKLFEENSFHNYKLVGNAENRGTVANVLSGVMIAEGKYCKTISPGDAINGIDSVAKWIEHIEQNNKLWGFSDCIYFYFDENENIVKTKAAAHPQIVDSYIQNDVNACKWNYIGLGDIAVGASIISEKEITLKYLYKIVGKVIYGEDNIYRIMAYDGIVADYYPVAVVFYEYGSGISTSNSEIWGKRLDDDGKATEKIMFENIDLTDKFQTRVFNVYKVKAMKKGILKIVKLLLIKGKLSFILRRKFKCRYTSE